MRGGTHEEQPIAGYSELIGQTGHDIPLPQPAAQPLPSHRLQLAKKIAAPYTKSASRTTL